MGEIGEAIRNDVCTAVDIDDIFKPKDGSVRFVVIADHAPVAVDAPVQEVIGHTGLGRGWVVVSVLAASGRSDCVAAYHVAAIAVLSCCGVVWPNAAARHKVSRCAAGAGLQDSDPVALPFGAKAADIG